MLISHLTRVSTFVLCLFFLSLAGMEQVKETPYLQKAPLTVWPTSTYDNAYQGATYNFSQHRQRFAQTGILAITTTKEKADKDRLDNEARTILDWFHALQRTEAELLKKPFETWTIEDLKTISACLTRLDIVTPGAFRTGQANWQVVHNISDQEWTYATLLAKRKHYAVNPEIFEKDKQEDPNLPLALSVPLTAEEEAYLKRIIYFFTPAEAIEGELQAALAVAQKSLLTLHDLPFAEQQQRALSIGCAFHFDMVRIHPFAEGSKRLGRLCMYIIHAQHGIAPCTITHGKGYINSLIASLKKGSHEPFEAFIRSCFEQEKPVTVAQKAPDKKTSKPQTIGAPAPNVSSKLLCAHCRKEGTDLQRCARCKSINYCNKDCQINHWKAGHKESCKATSDKPTAKK